MNYLSILRATLPGDEGTRQFPYTDQFGNITIGIGRNLTANGLKDGEISFLFSNDVRDADKDARALVPNFDELDDVRKAVLCNMAFNLGQEGLSEFKHMLAAIQAGDWTAAASEMLTSKWAQQVKKRAQRLSAQMKTGEVK